MDSSGKRERSFRGSEQREGGSGSRFDGNSYSYGQQQQQDDPKRFRGDEILGHNEHGHGKVMTRLLVNKDEFSRIIGKGGR